MKVVGVGKWTLTRCVYPFFLRTAGSDKGSKTGNGRNGTRSPVRLRFRSESPGGGDDDDRRSSRRSRSSSPCERRGGSKRPSERSRSPSRSPSRQRSRSRSRSPRSSDSRSNSPYTMPTFLRQAQRSPTPPTEMSVPSLDSRLLPIDTIAIFYGVLRFVSQSVSGLHERHHAETGREQPRSPIVAQDGLGWRRPRSQRARHRRTHKRRRGSYLITTIISVISS